MNTAKFLKVNSNGFLVLSHSLREGIDVHHFFAPQWRSTMNGVRQLSLPTK